jgi:hypothetical protein
MSAHTLLLDVVASCLPKFSALDLCCLLVVAREELSRRKAFDAALLLDHAARTFALEVSGPDAPSDNGHQVNGDSGAAG